MCFHIYTLCMLPILFISAQCMQHNYQFEVFVSNVPWSGTTDEIFFRLCNINDICGLFISVPNGWQQTKQTYSYTYTTNQDIGDIYKVEIVHPGTDILCINHIKVNNIQYDHNGSGWWAGSHCIEQTGDGGCDTLTIILPNNHWNSSLTIPCQYEQELYDTYFPTLEPSISQISFPTQNPTIFPTISPTMYPTLTPINNGTVNVSENPTVTPTVDVNTKYVSTRTTKVQFGLINAKKEDINIGVIIAVIIAGLVVIIIIFSISVYCWRKKKNMKECVKEVNDEEVSSESTVIHHPIISMEGDKATEGEMKEGVNKEREQLIVSFDSNESTDDDDEGLYEIVRENVTNTPISNGNDNILLDDVDENTDDEDNEELYNNNRRQRTNKYRSLLGEQQSVDVEDDNDIQ